jgi:hypothetical protein
MRAIRNCNFENRCRSRDWNDLAQVEGEPLVRFCSTCESPVFFCIHADDLEDHLRKNHCVALELDVGDSRITIMGDFAPRRSAFESDLTEEESEDSLRERREAYEKREQDFSELMAAWETYEATGDKAALEFILSKSKPSS